MTPQHIVAAADAVFCAAPPRGWLDCCLAIDMVVLRVGGVSPMGGYVGTYDCPLEIARRIARHGGWHAHFAAVVESSGYRAGSAQTGAIGYVTNTDTLFGFTAAICVKPGCWLAPVDHGSVTMKEALFAWSHL